MNRDQRRCINTAPANTFPYSEDRHITPPPTTVEQFLQFKKSLGLTNSALTHGLSYGDDCRPLKHFVSRLGTVQTRAIGVIDPETTTDAEMREMHGYGTRGVRVNLYRYGAMDDVELQKKALLAHAERMRSLGLPWSLTMTTTRTEFWDELGPFVEGNLVPHGIPMVTDHFAVLKGPSMLPPEYRDDPTTQPAFASVVRLVQQGHLWIKLSAPYRVSEMKPDYAELKFLVRALVDANKHRVIWGSDWPHTPRMRVRTRKEAVKETPYLEVDDLSWLESLRSWLSDEEWHLLMVDNPKVLFG